MSLRLEASVNRQIIGMVMQSRTLVKWLALNVLPFSVAFALKKRYYRRAIQTFWEPDVYPLSYIVRKGDIVVDVGAHVGWYTRILAQLVGDEGQVYSIEPIEETYELLESTVKFLRLKNVKAIKYAVAEVDGTTLMVVPRDSDGILNYYRSKRVEKVKTGKCFSHEKVLQRSLDSLFLGKSERIAFIKCDVEGSEYLVVRGAEGIIRQSKPAWLIEVCGNPDLEHGHARDLIGLLRQEGYAAYWFDNHRLERRREGDGATNYFFLQAGHVERLRTHNLL